MCVCVCCVLCRLLLGFPADCWTPDLVPAALSEALSASLTDALCVAALPAGWAPAVRLVLQRLRPDVIQVLSVAEEGETAACAARTLQEQVCTVYIHTHTYAHTRTHAHAHSVAQGGCTHATRYQDSPACTSWNPDEDNGMFVCLFVCACVCVCVCAQLPHLLSGTVAPREWLDTLQSALLALDLAPDDSTLLQTIVQVREEHTILTHADRYTQGHVHTPQ